MERSEAYTVFQSTVADVLDIDPVMVVSEAGWAALDADSLAVLEITLALSDAFGIKIPDVEPADFSTVGQAFAFVWKVVSGG